MKSLVLTIPAEHQEAANRIAVALGHDSAPLPGQTFIVGFSADGSAPATHYSARTQADVQFTTLLMDAAAGTVPEMPPSGAWEDFGLSVETVEAVVASLLFDIRSEAELEDRGWGYADHLINANANWGLAPVETSAE